MPPKDSARSLRDMKEMLTNLPQFQDLKAKVDICAMTMQVYVCDIPRSNIEHSIRHILALPRSACLFLRSRN